MATNKSLVPNIDLSDLVNFPNGRIKDNTGAGDGTPVNRLVYSDLHEFFAKLMRLAKINYNGLPESEGNGYQLVQALMNFAVKNDYVTPLNVVEVVIAGVNTNVLSIGLAISTLNLNEAIMFQAAADFNSGITLIAGTEAGVYKTINVPSSYKANDYVQMIVTSGGVSLIRLANAGNIEELATEQGFLKAATDLEEITGTATNVATTPETNLTAFTDRVNGDSSEAFLATTTQNGLMSAADKTTLASLNNPVKNVGWISGVDPGGGTVGSGYAVHGDIASAILQSTGGGHLAQLLVTFNNEITGNYFVRTMVENIGDATQSQDLFCPVFTVVNSTSFKWQIAENVNGTQALKIHIEVVAIS